MEPLKLVALDTDDLEIVSAHLQDSVLQVSDVHWLPSQNRLVIGLNRFDWEAMQDGVPAFQRRRSALRFDRVTDLKCRNLSPKHKDQVLNLLAITFEEAEPPAGAVMLCFSGGGMLRVEVECIEAELADLGPVWKTVCCPQHSDLEQSHGAPEASAARQG